MRKMAQGVLVEGDILRAIAAVDDLHAALSALHMVAKECADAVDRALVQAMADSGAGRILTTACTLTLVERGPQAVVVDRDLVPPRFLKPPRQPDPDIGAITKAMRAGESVPGAALSNASPHIRRVSRSR